MASWYLWAPSWRAAAKATLSFLPGCLPGQLGLEPPGKLSLDKVKEASLKKTPCKTWGEQTLGSRCGHGGLSY